MKKNRKLIELVLMDFLIPIQNESKTSDAIKKITAFIAFLTKSIDFE